MESDPLVVAAALAAVLDEVGVRYVVGGSLASTVHGEPRSTLDVDVAIQLTEAQLDPLYTRLAREFFVMREAVARAIEHHTAFNALHRRTHLKVDVYVRPPTGIFASEIERARPVEVAPGLALRIATAEDTILQKLRWYRLGGEVSDRQWRDVLGMLEVAPRLDDVYLDEWAGRLGLGDLLAQARVEARG